MYSRSSCDYSGNSQAPPHIMYLMLHFTQGLAGGVLSLRRRTDRVSPLWVLSHCVDTSVPHEPPCFLIMFGDWINVSSPNHQITCYIFSVLLSDVQEPKDLESNYLGKGESKRKEREYATIIMWLFPQQMWMNVSVKDRASQHICSNGS